ncbi:acetate--CoA ligase family protein [Prosthecochloris sp. N3]|uniref:Acetate--CoA ligase family protein n=1 Tax=Prosthecochloris ethylica TaxID=2743976 RepID=A0ABR9XPP2_9CHLB|nr:ATP citrate lyase citrate-binding domain-containing protein [Prosthecochloris ethylica]MBF0586243.1 acetate--CoA ligase family protein [Prosthecochloris ethylica]MBF0635949.1 acetate--CoA ligase family protein [Prosthecochloris ethylica]NUK47376.1 acetate--CoA ligase family protein [Prosthecochloris ethylica]
MAKILEGSAMKFFNKWGIPVPNYVVVMDPNRLAQLGEANKWLRESKLVVKAHEAIGGRFKLGLVKIGLNLEEAVEAAREMIGKKVGTAEIRQVIVAEMLDHDEEYYISMAGNRDGAELLLSSKGGVDIEDNWESVRRIAIPVDDAPSIESLTELAIDAGFPEGEIAERVAKIASRLILCFDNEDAQSIEINPLVIRKSDMRFAALDAVMNVDWDARFRHPDWDFKPVSEIGRPFTEAEQQIMDIDSRIKGSVKFVEVPGGEVALLTAGGGASVFYADAVVARGGTIANYAEYSGAPADWAVEALTETLCQLPNIKHIIVGGAIANFTDVKATFGGIINGLRESKANGYLDGVKIWVRRGGPNEAEGLAAISKLKDEGFEIHVYDRNMPMTDIVDLAMNS